MFKSGVSQENLCFDLIALTPREYVVGFTGELRIHDLRGLLVTMPNIESLNLGGLVVSDTFLRPDPVPRTKFLPSL